MTVQVIDPHTIVLEGICASNDAEVLLQRLLAMPDAVVNLRECESLHAAVLQVLLAARPTLHLPAQDAAGGWLRRLLLPAITD